MSDSLFDVEVAKPDHDFVCLRDETRVVEERRFAEVLWKKFQPYAEKKFDKKIANDWKGQFWEMYLACALLDQGVDLVPQNGNGNNPDVQILHAGNRTWIEAAVPRTGEGTDKIPESKQLKSQPGLPFSDVEWFSVPSNKQYLRFANALSAKAEQYERFLDKGVVKENDPYVIAINGSELPYLIWDDVPPIVQAAFGIGDISAVYEWENDGVLEVGYPAAEGIAKASGGPVTFGFAPWISGFLFSRSSVWQHHRQLGQDFHFVRNPTPNNPLPSGWLARGHEWRDEGSYLVSEDLESGSQKRYPRLRGQ